MPTESYVLLEDIVIPAGTVLFPASKCVMRVTPHFERDIRLGDDHTYSFCIDEHAMESNPDMFRKTR